MADHDLGNHGSTGISGGSSYADDEDLPLVVPVVARQPELEQATAPARSASAPAAVATAPRAIETAPRAAAADAATIAPSMGAGGGLPAADPTGTSGASAAELTAGGLGPAHARPSGGALDADREVVVTQTAAHPAESAPQPSGAAPQTAEPAPTAVAPSASAPEPARPTREEELARTLDELLEEDPDIHAAALVSLDGFTMASALPSDLQPDRVGAMSAAILALGERASAELGRGSLAQVFIEGEDGYVLLVAAGSWAVLTAIADPSAKLGLVIYDMKKTAERIGRILG